ncbi:MAG: guanylate kinase [Methylocystaceae bacterium]
MFEHRQGILFVVSGPSGVGKGTINTRVVERTNNLMFSVSVTTRSARTGETNGKEYFFVSREEFAALRDQDELLEWALVYNNWYGTPRKFVYEQLETGHDVLLEIDIQGAMQVKQRYPEGVFVFIAPPSQEELCNRITGRGKDKPEDIARRLAEYPEEIKCYVDYDYLVVNDEVEKATAKVLAIVEAERCRVQRIKEEC